LGITFVQLGSEAVLEPTLKFEEAVPQSMV
jgi:hypothetical protein